MIKFARYLARRLGQLCALAAAMLTFLQIIVRKDISPHVTTAMAKTFHDGGAVWGTIGLLLAISFGLLLIGYSNRIANCAKRASETSAGGHLRSLR